VWGKMVTWRANHKNSVTGRGKVRGTGREQADILEGRNSFKGEKTYALECRVAPGDGFPLFTEIPNRAPPSQGPKTDGIQTILCSKPLQKYTCPRTHDLKGQEAKRGEGQHVGRNCRKEAKDRRRGFPAVGTKLQLKGADTRRRKGGCEQKRVGRAFPEGRQGDEGGAVTEPEKTRNACGIENNERYTENKKNWVKG